MIVSTIATGVSRLLDIVLSAYIYNDEYRYPFFIAFTQFALLSLFTKVYTSIRTSKCIAGTIRDDDILSPTTQSVRYPKVTRRTTLLIAISWFITRVFSNLNNVEVRVARASEAAVPLLLLPACSYYKLIQIDVKVAALTLATSIALILNCSIDARAVSAGVVCLRILNVVSQAVFLTLFNKTIREDYKSPIFALHAYAPTATIISLIFSILFEGVAPLHDLPIIGLVILVENVLVFLASQVSIAFLLHQTNVIAWSSVSYLVTISLVVIAAFVTEQAPPLGQSVVTFCAAFLSLLLLRTQIPSLKDAQPPTPRLQLSKLSTHLEPSISHVTGLQTQTPPSLSRTNSSQRVRHAEEI